MDVIAGTPYAAISEYVAFLSLAGSITVDFEAAHRNGTAGCHRQIALVLTLGDDSRLHLVVLHRAGKTAAGGSRTLSYHLVHRVVQGHLGAGNWLCCEYVRHEDGILSLVRTFADDRKV